MAIDTAITIGCTDLQRKGGLRYVGLFDWTLLSSQQITYSGSNHQISSLGASETGYLYEFKDETATLNISATKENGQTTFEITVEMYIPKMTSPKFFEINKAMDVCLFACVQDTNGINWILGISEAYENVDVNYRNQTFGTLSAMEGSTSPAYTEENGITLTFSCRQYELPYVYSGSVTISTSAGTMVLA